MKSSDWVLVGGIALAAYIANNQLNKLQDKLPDFSPSVQTPSITVPTLPEVPNIVEIIKDILPTGSELGTFVGVGGGGTTTERTTDLKITEPLNTLGDQIANTFKETQQMLENKFPNLEVVKTIPVTPNILVTLPDPVSTYSFWADGTPAISGVQSTTASKVVSTILTPSGNTLTQTVTTVPPTDDPFMKVVQEVGGGSHYAVNKSVKKTDDNINASRKANLANIIKQGAKVSDITRKKYGL